MCLLTHFYANSCTMKIRLYFTFIVIIWLNCFQTVNASVIDDSGPNPLIVIKTFGFMKQGIENLAVDGCRALFETDGGLYSHAIQRIYINYDLNKANWRSAVYQPDNVNNIVWFEIFGETGLRKISYDHTFENEDELRIGVGFLGLTVGPQKDIKIQLPNYMTKERYDRAYLDLTEQCPGSEGGY